MLLSLCMIVKNEEKVLGRCLDSVRGLVDEIIIVDTGSEDRTKEIAEQYTNQVFDFAWTNDFAAARNESLRYASGKWILVLDADEYVESGKHEQLREKLRNIRANKPQCFLLKVINFHGARGEQIYESTAARLFTNSRGMRYEDPIHEQLACTSGNIQYSYDSFMIFHSGYTTETVIEKGKNRRNLDILRGMESESKLKDPYFCFVIGNEYSNAGLEGQAFTYYKRAIVDAPLNTTWYAHLLDRLCQSALKTRHLKEAETYIQKGKKLWPNAADYYCLEGVMYECLGFYNRAAEAFRACLSIAEKCEAEGESYWVTQESYGKSIPHQKSAEIARKKGDLHQLVYHLTAVLRQDPNNFAVLRTLLRTLATHDSAGNVQAFMEKTYPVSDPKNAFILLQVSLLEGSSELASVYWEACQASRVPISYDVELSYSLLLKRPMERDDSQRLDSSLALFASVAFKEPKYITLAESPGDVLGQLSSRLNQTGAAGDAASPLQLEEYALLTQLLVQLLQYGYIDEYEQLVNRFADEELLHALAEQMSLLGYSDIAIDLYSILLDNGLLRGEGYKQMAIYCYELGNPQDGVQFMERAVQLSPALDMLGLVIENSEGLDISEFMLHFSGWSNLDNIPQDIAEKCIR